MRGRTNRANRKPEQRLPSSAKRPSLSIKKGNKAAGRAFSFFFSCWERMRGTWLPSLLAKYTRAGSCITAAYQYWTTSSVPLPNRGGGKRCSVHADRRLLRDSPIFPKKKKKITSTRNKTLASPHLVGSGKATLPALSGKQIARDCLEKLCLVLHQTASASFVIKRNAVRSNFILPKMRKRGDVTERPGKRPQRKKKRKVDSGVTVESPHCSGVRRSNSKEAKA